MTKISPDELEQLQDSDSWDFPNAQRRDPEPNRRVIVSVGFQRSDYELVTSAAERCGQRISQFIREAAVDRATEGAQLVGIRAYGPAFIVVGGTEQSPHTNATGELLFYSGDKGVRDIEPVTT